MIVTVSLQSHLFPQLHRLVAFPFAVRYPVVVHFLRGAVRFGRVLDRRRGVVVFLLGNISITIEVREQEVEEHRVRQYQNDRPFRIVAIVKQQ